MIVLVIIMIFSIEKLINSLPTYQDRIAEIKVNIQSWFNARGIASDKVNDVLSMNVFKPENIVNFSINIATSIGHALSNWGFILFIAALMLLESVSQPDKLRKAMRADSPMPKRLIEFNKNIRSYFVLNAWLGLLVAVLNTIFLSILGVDFAHPLGDTFLPSQFRAHSRLLDLVHPADVPGPARIRPGPGGDRRDRIHNHQYDR